MVALAIYGAFAAVTLGYHALPWYAVLALGGCVVTWHGSLQHEVVHGHPTPWRWVNRALVFPSLWLWLPFELYRATHLHHHRTEQLTVPAIDPESAYLLENCYRALPRWRRALERWQRCLAGRLLIGPIAEIAKLGCSELARARDGNLDARAWAIHAAAVGVVLLWVIAVCSIPFVEYLVLFVLPGTSFTLLRSFAEHRAAESPSHRTVIVEAEAPLALLFLNNNLHALHHREPWRAWYELPRRYRQHREEVLALNGHYVFKGYREVARRFGLRPRDAVVHPFV